MYNTSSRVVIESIKHSQQRYCLQFIPIKVNFEIIVTIIMKNDVEQCLVIIHLLNNKI